MRTIRPYRPEDREELLELHRVYGRTFKPDPDYHLHAGTIVVEEDGKIVASGCGRLTAELILCISKDFSTPAGRWDLIKELLAHSAREARKRGFDELHLPIAQGLQRFAERLVTVPDVYLDDRFHLLFDVRDEESRKEAV